MKSMNAELNTKSIIVHYIHDEAAETMSEIGSKSQSKGMRRGDSFVIKKGRAQSTVSSKTQHFIEVTAIMQNTERFIKVMDV